MLRPPMITIVFVVLVGSSKGQAQDLQVVKTTAPYSGSTAHARAVFTVQCEVKNAGTKALTSGFELHYFYCPAASTKLCVKLGSSKIADKLGPNKSGTYTSGKLMLPSSVDFGTGQIRFLVDATGSIKETNEANNNSYDSISVTTRPDLRVASPVVPYTGSTATKGASFTGRYSILVDASSSRVTGTFSVAYYYCPEASNNNCVALGSETISQAINAGASHSYTSMKLTIPQVAQNGRRHVRAVVDATGVVAESNENNNEDYDEITVDSIPSDLRVTLIKAPYTGSVAGAKSKFTVQFQLQNDSANPFSADFVVHYFYCPKVSTSGCVKLGEIFVPDDFAAKQQRTYTSATLVLPASVLFGTGQIRIFADATGKVTESNEGNNNGYSSINVSARPDLSFAATTVPFSGSTAAVGSTFTGRYIITNAGGTSRSTTDFWIKYEYCADQAGTNCTYLDQQTITRDLDAGASYPHTSKTLTMPGVAQNGKRYIRATLDAGDKVTESNEKNNLDLDEITVSSVPSDIKITALKVPYVGSVTFAGAKFTTQFRIDNGSKNGFTQDFEVHFFYCPSKSTSGCSKIGSKKIPDDFGANQQRTYLSPVLALPNSALLGAGQIRFFADATGVLAESDETNNEASSAITVTTLPDLSISAAKVPDSGSASTPGASFTGQFTILNAKATSRLTTNFAVAYFDCPIKAVKGCVQIGKQKIITDLDAGASYTYTSTTLSVPVKASSGTRYVRALVDANNVVKESDESNNGRYEAVQVTGPTDLTVSAFSATVKGTGVTYAVKVCNTGDSTTTSFTLGLYHNRALAPPCGFTPDQQWSIAGLKSNSCVNQSATVTLVKPGVYLAWAVVDAGCKVLESNEKNNSLSAALTQVVLDAGVDGAEGGVGDGGCTDGACLDAKVCPGDGACSDAGSGEAGSADAGGEAAIPDAQGEAGSADAGKEAAIPDAHGEAGSPDAGAEAGSERDRGSDSRDRGADWIKQADAPWMDGGWSPTSRPPEEEGGCGCSTGLAAPGLPALIFPALCLLLLVRRRSR